MKVGAEIDVKESDGNTYQANVLKVEGSKCLVHYKGWASSWDEWLEIPKDGEGLVKEIKSTEKVSKSKAPAKSDKRKHSDSTSSSSSCSSDQREPPLKKLKPEVVSELETSSKDVEVSLGSGTPLDQSLDQSLTKSASSSDISETSTQKKNIFTPSAASSSKATPVPKTSSKKTATPDEKQQKTILSFFTRFNPASQKKPQLKSAKTPKQVDEDSDEVEILEKVSPTKMDNKAEEKKADKKAETNVVSSPLGFFRLAEGEEKEKEEKKGGKFTCQHCKITFSNMLTWKSHEDGHTQVDRHSQVQVKLAMTRFTFTHSLYIATISFSGQALLHSL